MKSDNVQGIVAHGKSFAGRSVNVLSASQPVLDIVKEVISYRRVVEEEQTKRDDIRAQRDVAIERIRMQRQIVMESLDRSFGERTEALSRLFDALDRGLANEHVDLAMQALGGIVRLVEKSPFSGIESVARVASMLEDDDSTLKL